MAPVGRRKVLTGLLGAAVLPLTGCGADLSRQDMSNSTGSPMAAASGPLLLRGTIAVSATTGTAALIATIFNHGRHGDALVNVEMDHGQALLQPKPSIIPAGASTVYGADTSLTNQPDAVTLWGEPVKAGFFVQLTFTFTHAAPARSGALVVKAQGPYRGVPLPSPR